MAATGRQLKHQRSSAFKYQLADTNSPFANDDNSSPPPLLCTFTDVQDLETHASVLSLSRAENSAIKAINNNCLGWGRG